ncbi:MAG: glycosyl hydrolase family 79 C-terminal domain-containing protein [Anaerolineales bacterium]
MARWGILLGMVLLLCQGATALGVASTRTPSIQAPPGLESTQTPSVPPTQSVVADQTPSASPVGEPVTVTVSPGQPGYPIPADFLGLSYEAPVLVQDDFDVSNTALVHLLTALGPGNLRFGGNSVERTYWDSFGRATPSPKTPTVQPADLDRLFAFTHQVDWSIILGVNLGDYSPQMAAAEAAYAWKNDKGQIAAIEIGNEPNVFPTNGLRPESWGVDDLLREFAAYVTAIHAAVPGAPIAGPATVDSLDWFTRFLAADSSALTLATHHIYPLTAAATVPPTSSRYATIPQLLSAATAARVDTEIKALSGVAAEYHVPLRMAETNSASDGGKDGVSNTFASALWGSDYLFVLAQHGVVGANFHGGFACTGYTPICLTADLQFHAQPLYYGMLFFHLAAEDGRLVPVMIQTSANVTAYAVAGADGSLRVALINKTADQDVTVQVNAGQTYGLASILRLAAPSLDAQNGVTLGGNAVAADGTWAPAATETVSPLGSGYSVALPAASAALLVLHQ